MNVTFKDKKMAQICSAISKAQAKYGKNAKKLMRRIEELKQASNLEYMRDLPGRCHELDGDKAGQLSIDISLPFCLYFEPIGKDIYHQDGGLDWRKVTTIRILDYGTNTHE